MQNHSALFETIDYLSSVEALTHNMVEEVLQRRLKLDPEGSNEFFHIYLWARKEGELSLIESIELREPTARAQAKGGLLILDIDPSSKVGLDEVMERFGSESEVAPPSPTAPPGEPVSYIYTQPWGRLIFGFQQNPPEHLIRVVMDRT